MPTPQEDPPTDDAAERRHALPALAGLLRAWGISATVQGDRMIAAAPGLRERVVSCGHGMFRFEPHGREIGPVGELDEAASAVLRAFQGWS
ncbi:hypothetical protein [Actinomadura fibrosa]|uniref:Uncharacterized protein n=1 Tax=Actinomadura fibrosa TaxID=111802 RepID=A0ABW2XNY2_9ACTN|nr:hypothetical protein [Actinomadura fibrosa]